MLSGVRSCSGVKNQLLQRRGRHQKYCTYQKSQKQLCKQQNQSLKKLLYSVAFTDLGRGCVF